MLLELLLLTFPRVDIMASPEEWKKMLKMVDQFYNRPDAEPFRDPVPWKEMGKILSSAPIAMAFRLFSRSFLLLFLFRM